MSMLSFQRGRLADDLINLLDQLLAGMNAAERVLGVAVLEVVDQRVIIGLDESVSGVEVGVADIALEMGEIVDIVVDADAVQKPDIRENIACIDPERFFLCATGRRSCHCGN